MDKKTWNEREKELSTSEEEIAEFERLQQELDAQEMMKMYFDEKRRSV